MLQACYSYWLCPKMEMQVHCTYVGVEDRRRQGNTAESEQGFFVLRRSSMTELSPTPTTPPTPDNNPGHGSPRPAPTQSWLWVLPFPRRNRSRALVSLGCGFAVSQLTLLHLRRPKRGNTVKCSPPEGKEKRHPNRGNTIRRQGNA